MFCPKCGKINPDDAVLCSGCHSPLQEEKEVPAKKQINWGKIILVAVIVVVAAVVVAMTLSGCGGGTLPEETMAF